MESVSTTLSRRIRRLRERKGLTQTQLAALVLSNKTTISDIELGHQVPALKQVQALGEALDDDGALLELYQLMNTGIQESVVVADVEHDAIAMTDWESRYIPGILQTTDYMRAQMKVSVPAGRIDKEIAIRLNRQKILKDLLSGWFIIEEAVLMRPVGGKEAMREQLLKLEYLAERPNINIQVMPFIVTDHPGSDGPLRVIDFAAKPNVWLTEGPRSGRMSDDRAEVIQALTSLNLIRAAALSVSDSVQFIQQVRESRYE